MSVKRTANIFTTRGACVIVDELEDGYGYDLIAVAVVTLLLAAGLLGLLLLLGSFLHCLQRSLPAIIQEFSYCYHYWVTTSGYDLLSF